MRIAAWCWRRLAFWNQLARCMHTARHLKATTSTAPTPTPTSTSTRSSTVTPAATHRLHAMHASVTSARVARAHCDGLVQRVHRVLVGVQDVVRHLGAAPAFGGRGHAGPAPCCCGPGPAGRQAVWCGPAGWGRSAKSSNIIGGSQSPFYRPSAVGGWHIIIIIIIIIITWSTRRPESLADGH
jgi:hypothetical protein